MPLLDLALNNSIRKRYGFNALFAGLDKAPRVVWEKWQTLAQTDDDIKAYFLNMGADNVSCWGFVCGFRGLQAFDFDWAWVYRLWKKSFGERADTLTVQTPNGGLRPHYICDKTKTVDKFKESLHTELKGPGRFVVYDGKASREDGSIGEYNVVNDKNIREDNNIIADTVAFLEETLKRYHFLRWNCLRPHFSEKVLGSPPHEVRLYICDIMASEDFSYDEIYNLFRDFSDYDHAKTDYQIRYTQDRVKAGLKPPTCETLRKTLGWNEPECAGCERKRHQKYAQKVEHENSESGRVSQADKMVGLVIDNGVELFHDDSKFCYARVTHSEAASIHRIRSREFKVWLSKILWENASKAPTSEALNSTINVLESKALFEGKEHRLYNRVAPDPDGNGIWIDMCNDKWQAIHVTAEGWQIVDKPPILFRRYSHQQPLVTPVRGGDPKKLFQYVNLAEDNEDDKALLIVEIIHFLIPSIPHVILLLYGVQGSAKTTLFKLIRSIIDPSSVEVLSIPRNERELVQQLAHHWCAFYDNVGDLPWWVSDALCRAATGGGFTKRELYTDDDDVIYSFRRCIGLNSINIAAQRPDLLDRCLLVGLKNIPKEKRKTEETLWQEFNNVKSKILGGLLDTLSKAIQIYPTIKLDELHRMADFVKWGCAISKALGIEQKKFLASYDANVKINIEEAARGSPVAEVILKFMIGKLNWEGTPTELYSKLLEMAKEIGISTRQKAWPKAPNSLIRRINELVPALAQLGYEVVETRKNKGRIIRINTVTTVTDGQVHEKNGKKGDGSDGSDDIFHTLTQENIETVLNAVMEAARVRGSAHISEIVLACKLPEDSIQAILRQLQREGKVHSVYEGWWKVV